MKIKGYPVRDFNDAESFSRYAIEVFNEALKKVDLDIDSIITSTIEELNFKLEIIDKYIDDPNLLEDLGVRTLYVGNLISGTDSLVIKNSIKLEIKSHLITIKKQILNNLKRKLSLIKIDSISKLIESVEDQTLQDKLNKELISLKEQNKKLSDDENKIENQIETFEAEQRQLKLKKDKLELFEKKSNIWLKFLAKESIASILGAFLLLVMTITIIIAMFMKIELVKIFESTFLLILGYFFGHSVTKKNDSKEI